MSVLFESCIHICMHRFGQKPLMGASFASVAYRNRFWCLSITLVSLSAYQSLKKLNYQPAYLLQLLAFILKYSFLP